MKYIQYVNQCIKNEAERAGSLVLFGQNVSAGSCIGGLCRGIGANNPACHVLNTPNIENTLVGVGFGLMLNGVSSIFFMKQQDFLLLGVDHMVNTYNFARIGKPSASFTIVTVVVDSGYEGIQSSLNNFSDFCSIARIEGYAITNKHDIEAVIGRHLISPGFRIIGVSQRLFNRELLAYAGEVRSIGNSEILQYGTGEALTVACFNFSLPQGMDMADKLKEKGIGTSIFSVNSVLPVDWTAIIESVKRTRKLLILDDSKSVNKSCYHLSHAVQCMYNPEKLVVLTREHDDDLLRPHSEEFIVDSDYIIQKFAL